MTKTKLLKVGDMQCGHCAESITKALKKMKGVFTVTVDLKAKTVAVEVTDDKISFDALKIAIEKIGFEVE